MDIKDTDEPEDNVFLWKERVKVGRIAKWASILPNGVYGFWKKINPIKQNNVR